MNDITAIQLAHQRMSEIGKKPEEYHLEVVEVVGTYAERVAGKIQFKAYNQYYYLFNTYGYYGLEIISDSGYWNSFDYTNNTIVEFTGAIIIQKINPAQPWSISNDEGGDIPTQNRPVEFVKVTIF
jgi:hypothetical protein